MIISRAAKGQGIYQDGEQKTGGGKPKKEKENQNASLAFNIMASFVGSGMNKGGNSKKVDALTTPFLDSLDIAGYNYGSGRYPLEYEHHQMINTEIRLIIFIAAKDGDALYSQQKQDLELTMAQIISPLLQNSGLN